MSDRVVTTREELEAVPEQCELVDSRRRGWVMHTRFEAGHGRESHLEVLVAQLPLTVRYHPDDALVSMTAGELARVKAEAKAEAWNEGFTRGFYDIFAGRNRDASESPAVNPYHPALVDPTTPTPTEGEQG